MRGDYRWEIIGYACFYFISHFLHCTSKKIMGIFFFDHIQSLMEGMQYDTIARVESDISLHHHLFWSPQKLHTSSTP